MRSRKGFTLIELLAVIVILALLMAVAIPSVTKYIETSRKKTVVNTMDGYITSITNEVNNRDYQFSTPNTIYAVPIECIEIERGGTNPFGEWLQASNDYWAYVLIEYDSDNFSYNYGFTFKDSGGYGLYPTLQYNISSTDINVGYDDLEKPITGLAVNYLESTKWNGFNINAETQLVVLESESEGVSGDGKETCTLCQKGSNYAEVEQSKNTLARLIKKHNTLITSEPTLTTSSNNSSDPSGLYSSTATNSGKPTYYFRGNVINNYVSFAGFTWKIIRINEDGTVRLIMQDGINNNATYEFNTEWRDYSYMYYSNSDKAKPKIEEWYETNITNKGYDSYVASEIFCEEAKVKIMEKYISGNVTMILYKEYTPNFECHTDGNGKGVFKSDVGLITYDEVIYAGGYQGVSNTDYYLYNRKSAWTMSPAGTSDTNYPHVWDFNHYYDGYGGYNGVIVKELLRPVINLNADVLATGTGTETDPYVIITE